MNPKLGKAVVYIMMGSVLLALCSMFIGIVLHLHQVGGQAFYPPLYPSAIWHVGSVSEFWSLLKTGNPFSLIELGIFLMVAGQILRVIMTAILFAYEKDKIFVGLSLIVVIIMLVSLK